MGSCCSHPSTTAFDSEVAERVPRRGRSGPASPRALDKHKKRDVFDSTVTHRLGYHDSSGSTASLSAIPNTIADRKKGFDAEHVTHSSSENSGSQLQALPHGYHNVNDFAHGHRPARPREGDGSDGHSHAAGSAGAATMPVHAVLPLSSLTSALSDAATSAPEGSLGSSVMNTAAAASAMGLLGSGGALAPFRRGPKQALLSYAEQYRTLQPFLRPHLRNRRWRLVFSSDVHGPHLMDRCSRVFRDEEVQWHAVTVAKLHHSLSGPSTHHSPNGTAHGRGSSTIENGSGLEAEVAQADVPDGASTTASSTFGQLPLIALMETALVVPAPKRIPAASAASLPDAASSPDNGDSLVDEHARPKLRVVDSHVCIGLYLQHRPAPDTITTYRRSEVFFFLFQSPIPAASTPKAAAVSLASVNAAAATAGGLQELGYAQQPQQLQPHPTVSAPPPSITQTSRRTQRADAGADDNNENEDDDSDALVNSVEHTRVDTLDRRTSFAGANTTTPASSPSKPVETPRTQTHRLSTLPRDQSSTDVVNTSTHVVSPGALFQNNEEEEEEETGVFDSSSVAPPQVTSTEVTRERHVDSTDIADVARAFDRHGGVVENRAPTAASAPVLGGNAMHRSSPPGAAVRHATLSPNSPNSSHHNRSLTNDGTDVPPPPPPAATGILSAEWQQQVSELQRDETREYSPLARAPPSTLQQPQDNGNACRGPRRREGSDAPLTSRDEDNAFSSVTVSTDDNDDDDVASLQRPRRSTTRRPPPLQTNVSVNGNTETAQQQLQQQQQQPAPLSTQSSAHDHLPAWAIEAVNAVRSPNTPVSPCPLNNEEDAAFVATQLSTPRISAPLPPNTALHSSPLHHGVNSLSLEDDVVSASTTVVSATSVPGMAWREDEDLSSYWPEAAAAAAQRRGAAGNGSGARREWYSPAMEPHQPTLSRVSSLGGDDTAECFTPRMPRQSSNVPTFAVPDDLERLPSNLTLNQNSPPLPGLVLPSPSSSSSPPFPTLAGKTAQNAASVSSSATGLNNVSESRSYEMNSTVGMTGMNVADNDGVRVEGVSSPVCCVAQSIRPVSTQVEVLTLKGCHDGHAESPGRPHDGVLHSETPSRSTSQLALSGGTIDVYCTSTGALYVWDAHKERMNGNDGNSSSSGTAAMQNGSGGVGEHEFIYQRDATGLRWNMGYFVNRGYGCGENHVSRTAANVTNDGGSSEIISSPVSEAHATSLFSFVRAQTRRDSAGAVEDSPSKFAEEVFVSPLVKMQLCAVSSRTMPATFQRSASNSVTATQ